MSAGLPGRLHAGRDPALGPHHEDRWVDREPHHERLHLRQGAGLPRAHLWRRSVAVSGGAPRRQGQGPVQARELGRCPGADRGEDAPHARHRRGREHPAPLLRRVQRLPDAGLCRRDLVPASRHVTPVAHGLRGADWCGQHGPVRQDGFGRLRRLPLRQDDHHLGREPWRVGHSLDAVPEGRARPRRLRGGARSARDHRGAAGRPAPGRAARHGSAGGIGHSSSSV